MVRPVSAIYVSALATGFLFVAAPSLLAANDIESEKEKLHGYWTVIDDSRKASGRARPFLYITSDKLVDWDERDYTIDPTQTPKQINSRGTNWQGAAVDGTGIYDLTNGTLKICWAIPDSRDRINRPVAFETNKPNGGLLIVLKRGDPNEGEFTRYHMATQAGTVANRVFRDEQGRTTVTIYYGEGPLHGFVPENLHPELVDIHDRNVQRLENGGISETHSTSLTGPILRHLANSGGFAVRGATDEDLKALSTLKQLQSLDIAGGRISERGLRSLKDQPSLHRLAIVRAGVSNQTMLAFRDWPQLRELSLADASVSDEGFAHLDLRLTGLGLNNLLLTDAGMKHLKRFAELRSLRLSRLEISDGALRHLRGLKQLERLNIEQIPMDGSALAYLKGASQLKVLALEHTRITDAALVHLVPLRNLETLYITDAEITDRGLKHLYGLKKLKTLNTHNTYVTFDALRALQRVLPELHRFP